MNSSDLTSPPIPTANVLVVEDEADLLDAMVTYLNMKGFKADGVRSLLAAEQWLRTHSHDVLLLDLGLPDGDGLQWLQAHGGLLNKGVIITSARGRIEQRVAGVEAGADAYLVKPVQLEELVHLVGNLARRLKDRPAGHWHMRRFLWTLESPNGVSIKLTHSEFKLLGRLAQSPGEAVARDALILAMGHDPLSYDGRRLEILVRRLRKKAQEQLGFELPLETAKRVGLAFTAPLSVT